MTAARKSSAHFIRTDTKNIFILSSLFFFSGAVCLAYEVVWVKMLALQFGSSAYSISTVVSAFMGGLGIGSWWAGRSARWIRRPFRVYALLEAGIAGYGLLSLSILGLSDRLIDVLYPFFVQRAVGFVLFRFIFSFLILVVPTILMGATLPVLVTAFRRDHRFQNVIGWLYGVNTMGAAAGVVLTGVIFLPMFGMKRMVMLAAVVGLIVALIAWLSDIHLDRAPREAPVDRSRLSRRAAPILAAAFAGGAVGIFYQICWTRLLSPVLGSSTYAFSIVLAVFLMGLAAGGLVLTWTHLAPSSLRRALALLLGTTSVAALLSFSLMNNLGGVLQALADVARERVGFLLAAQALVAATIILVPAIVMGATLPMAISAYRGLVPRSTEAVGVVYAVNTVGSILGAIAAGFICLPFLGVQRSALLASSFGLAVAWYLVVFDGAAPQRQRVLGGSLVAALMLGLIFLHPSVDVKRLQSGVFRSILFKPDPRSEPNAELLFSKDGMTSSVTVYRSPTNTAIRVNGKTDASSLGDLKTQYLLGHLPFLFHPGAKSACVVGYGSGSSAFAMAGHPVEHLDLIEIEPAVVEASPFFASVNGNVLADPRSHLYIEDGRSFLRFTRNRYDVILSQPSNPWITGIGFLFTTEYYELVRKRLDPGGVFCQWIQTYELSSETLNVMVRTLADAFPNVLMFLVDGDLICLASEKPLATSREHLESAMRRPLVKASLRRIGVESIGDLLIHLFSRLPSDLESFPATQRNTDDNVWLEYRAPIEMYLRLRPHLSRPGGADLLRLSAAVISGEADDPLAMQLASAISRRQPKAGRLIAEMKPFVVSPPARRDLDRSEREALARADLPSRIGALRGAAIEAHRSGETKKAYAILKEAEALNPADADTHRLLGDAAQLLGRRSEATAYYESTLETYPDDYLSHGHLGVLYLIQNQPEKGEVHLRRAIRLNPYFIPARVNLVTHLLRSGRDDEAEDGMENARRVLQPTQWAEFETALKRGFRRSY